MAVLGGKKQKKVLVECSLTHKEEAVDVRLYLVTSQSVML